MQFLAVYIHEAHPLDGVLPERQSGRWLVGTPERRLFVEDPITFEERLTLALRCEEEMQLGYPMLVDELDDAVNIAYAAWPERLYVVDLDGTLVYRGDRGPGGFLPDELATVLERCADSWSRGLPAGKDGRLERAKPKGPKGPKGMSKRAR